MFHRHQESGSVRVVGKVLDRQTLPGPRAPHPKLVTVELHPQDGPPFQAEVHVIFGDRHRWHDDLYYPQVGDITGFVYHAGSSEAWFDMSDPRNSMSAHTAGTDAWVAMADSDEPIQVDTGPPWLVAPTCQGCGMQINQRMAAAEAQPHCSRCLQPLTALPVITGELRRESQS